MGRFSRKKKRRVTILCNVSSDARNVSFIIVEEGWNDIYRRKEE